MPIFTAAAAAIVSTTALTGLAATIATNIIAVGLLVGTNQLLGLDEVDGPAAPVDEGVDVRLGANTQNRLPILYGDFQSRGIVCFYTLSENKQSLTTVLALGEGPITSIDEVLWEDYTLTLDPISGIVTNATRLVGTETETTDKYNGKISVQLNPAGGRSTYLEGITSDWTSAHTMSNIAYVIVSIDYDREAGITGLSDMRFRGTGAVDNPATAVRNLLQNSVYGVGLPDASIDITSFNTAVAYFNEQVSFDNDSETQKRSRLNGVLNASDTVSRRIGIILEGCNSSLRWYNGQWGLFIDKEDNATSFTFDTDNIIGSINVVETGLTNLYNRMVIEYGRGVENNYQRATVELLTPDAVRYPNEIDRTINLSLPLVNNSTEAQAIGTVILNKGRQQLSVSHRADVTAMPLEPGDVVRYNDEDYGWSNKLFRVISVAEIYENGALSYEIQSVEYADAVYDYGVLNAHDVSPNAATVSVEDINAVNDLAATGLFPNRAVPAIQLSWTVPDNSLIEAFDIFYSVGGTQFNSSTTLFIKTALPTVGNFTTGATVTEEVTGIPGGNITFWVVGRNDFTRSGPSNAVTVANYQPNAVLGAETLYRFNETPSVIAGVNIDVGAPPANETGIGTGRNNNVNDTGWYESELDASDRENAPVWTAITTVTRADAEPRELDFLFTGTSGDTVTTQTPTNQIIDFELAGTIGDNELQYVARPEITQFTFSGQAAEADSVDPGLAEVWQIDVTGTTDAPADPTNEEFYILPAGTSDTYIPESFTFTPSGNTADGIEPINVNTGLTYVISGTALNTFTLSVNGSGLPPSQGFNNLTNFTANTSFNLHLSSIDGATVASFIGIPVSNTFQTPPDPNFSWEFTDGTNVVRGDTLLDSRVTLPSAGRSTVSLPIRRNSSTPSLTTGLINGLFNTGSTGWSFTITDTATQSSVTITIDTIINTYTLADNLSGGVAIGSALNTAIGTDFTGFTKTIDASTGAITLTADDIDNHTGSSSVVQGTNGTIAIVDTNVDQSGAATTIQLQVTELSIDETIELLSNVTDQALLDDIETKLLANTPITNQFTVSQDTVTIDGNDVTVIKLVAISIADLSLALSINSGIIGTTSGTLVDGAVSGVATSITITYDPDILPVTQMLTFGENATSVQVATELTALIDGHGDLEATQGDTFTEVEEIVSFAPPTADQIALLDAVPDISIVTNNAGQSLPSPRKFFGISGNGSNLDVEVIDQMFYERSGSSPEVSLTEIVGNTLLVINVGSLFPNSWGLYTITSASFSDFANRYTFDLLFINGFGRIISSDMNSTAYFNSNGNIDDVVNIFNGNVKTTSTNFIENLSSSSILIKPDIVGDQTEPVVVINTQGTGDANFTISTPLEGRIAVAGSPAFTEYVISYDGIELRREFVASANSSSDATIQITAEINTSTELTATSSGSVITTTSTTNSPADTTISIIPGTNESGKASTNDLSVSRAVTNLGSATDVFAGVDTTVTVRVSGEVYYTATYNASDDTIPGILDDLVIGIDEIVPGFDLNERWDADVQDDSTIRATALGTGTDPTITISIAAGSTAVTDAIGNITVTPATLASTATIINAGVVTDITSGELSTFTVTQGTDALISAMSITGNSSPTSVATQIASAISMIMESEYTTSASGPNLLATLLENNSTPDLTISVSPGLFTDDTAADLAVTRTVNQIGSIGVLDLTGATWTYFISSPTTDGDTTMITPDGTIAVRRGLFLNSLAASRDGQNDNNNQVVFGTDLYTTASQPSIIDLTGVLHFYVAITEATDDISVFLQATMQFTTDTDDLDNATWTTIDGAISNRAFAIVVTGDTRIGAHQYVSISFAKDNYDGLSPSTEYAFRILLQGVKNSVAVAVPNNVANLLYGTFQLQEILTVT